MHLAAMVYYVYFKKICAKVFYSSRIFAVDQQTKIFSCLLIVTKFSWFFTDDNQFWGRERSI